MEKIELFARAERRDNINPIIVTVLMDEVMSGIEDLMLQTGEVSELSLMHVVCT